MLDRLASRRGATTFEYLLIAVAVAAVGVPLLNKKFGGPVSGEMRENRQAMVDFIAQKKKRPVTSRWFSSERTPTRNSDEAPPPEAEPSQAKLLRNRPQVPPPEGEVSPSQSPTPADSEGQDEKMISSLFGGSEQVVAEGPLANQARSRAVSSAMPREAGTGPVGEEVAIDTDAPAPATELNLWKILRTLILVFMVLLIAWLFMGQLRLIRR